MKRYIIYAIIVTFAISCFAFEQPQRLVRTPTAGLLEHLSYSSELEMLPGGNVITWLNMGFFGRSQLGVSYGGQNLLGYGNGDFYDRVGFQIRARILDEATNYPAIVIGIDTQGYGRWHKDLKRYTIKSTGPFIAVSKNWWSLGGNSGVHGGINYTLETEDKASVSCFFGVDKDIDNIAGIYIDYDLALADFDNDDAFGEGKGYLNASLWWQITDFFRIDILLLDMLGNGDYNSSFGRGIRVTFNDNLRKGGS